MLVEAPTFLGVLQTLKIAGAELISVPSDGEGVIIDELEKLIKEHRPKLFTAYPRSRILPAKRWALKEGRP